MIVLNDVTIGYQKKRVLEHITYKFEDTGMYAIIGKSGIGKTTLLSTIANLIKPLDGHLYYSMDVADLSSSIGYAFQDGNLLDELTVLENINTLVEILPTTTEVDQVLEKLGILKYKNAKIKSLSGGERQRVSLALAIIRDSNIIIVDEPTANLDYDNAIIIFDILKEMSKKKLIIFSSHDMEFVNKYADFVLDLKNKCTNITYDANMIEGYYSKRKIKPKFFLRIYHKTNRVNHITILITSMICTILLAVLSFFVTLNDCKKEDIITKYIKDNGIEQIAVASNSLENSNTDLEKYDIDYTALRKEHVSNLGFYAANYNYITNGAIEYIACDDTLNDMEIILTDYSLDTLRKTNIISFNDYNECIGQKLYYDSYYGYYECTIVQIKYTGYSKLNDTDSDFKIDSLDEYAKMCYQTMYCNSLSYFYLFDDHGVYNISLDGIDINLCKSENCTDNKMKLSNDAYNEYVKRTGKELVVGDEASFEIASRNGKKVFSLIYAGQVPTNNNSIYVSDDYFYNIVESLYSFKADSFFVKMYKDYTSLLQDMVRKNVDFIYDGKDSLSAVLTQIDNISSSVMVAIIISTILIFIINAVSMIMQSNNNRYQFSVLENYGIDKRYEAYTLVLNNFISYMIEYAIGNLFYLVIISSYNAYINVSFDFDSLLSYSFKAVVISFLFVLIANIMSLCGYFLLLMKRKTANHIINS